LEQLEVLKEQLKQFSAERDWDQFHSPKNLSMALAVEASELLEIFQWMQEAESLDPDIKLRERIREELADVFVYCLLMSNKLGIDLVAAATDKLQKNAAKYPADRVKGSSKKYTEY
jgi:NTP pyrophosphatase (non-canonical NTP hydrolase)